MHCEQILHGLYVQIFFSITLLNFRGSLSKRQSKSLQSNLTYSIQEDGNNVQAEVDIDDVPPVPNDDNEIQDDINQFPNDVLKRSSDLLKVFVFHQILSITDVSFI